MSTDTSGRELLELAARAAGIAPVLCYESRRNLLRIGDRNSYRLWNPLTDDGDALRLAVKLCFTIEHNDPRDDKEWVAILSRKQEALASEFVDDDTERLAATRRCIVRAAAEIGRQMP